MKRAFLGVAAAALLLVVPISAVASHGGGKSAGPFDFVTGSTKRVLTSGNTIGVNVSAHDSKKGVKGHVTHHNFDTDSKIHGDVRCLRVNGNTAVVGVVVTRSSDPNVPEGTGFYYSFSDNDRTPLEDSGDAVIPGMPAANPEQCPPAPAQFTRPTTSGNYVVHDAS